MGSSNEELLPLPARRYQWRLELPILPTSNGEAPTWLSVEAEWRPVFRPPAGSPAAVPYPPLSVLEPCQREPAETEGLEKIQNDLIRHYSKEDLRMANKHKKRCSISSAIRETQMKTRRHHNTPLRGV